MNLPNFDFEYQVHWFNSPGYLLAKVPELVQRETFDSLQKLETGEIEKIDWRDQLKGHLKEEWKLPIKPHMSFLAESLGFLAQIFAQVFVQKFVPDEAAELVERSPAQVHGASRM